MSSCHDISDGGLLVSLTEMCLASNIGFKFIKKDNSHQFLFGEDQGRYLFSSKRKFSKKNKEILDNNKIPNCILGTFGKQSSKPQLTLPNGNTILIEELKKAHEEWFPKYMSKEQKV